MASTVWLPLGDDCRLRVRGPGRPMVSADSALSDGAGLSGRQPTVVGVWGSCDNGFKCHSRNNHNHLLRRSARSMIDGCVCWAQAQLAQAWHAASQKQQQ